MTGLDLAELKRLEAAATPGPWFIHDFSGLEGIKQPKARDVTISCDHPATITVAEMGGGLDGHKGVSQGQYDAALIAALRNAALALIAKAERADKYQSDYAQLFDKMQGTPCAQIAWQQELDAANARIVELESKVYVPGLWKCAKCSFTLVQRVLRASDGAVGVRDKPGENRPIRDKPGENCPNCAVPLWRVGERDAGNELADRAQEYLQRAVSAEHRISELEAALIPFAKTAEKLWEGYEDNERGWMGNTPYPPSVGDLRRARAALASKPGADGETGK
jgi:hypothetical protein